MAGESNEALRRTKRGALILDPKKLPWHLSYSSPWR